ncbi:hypothetical protein DKX38_025906 [Salix brachista]|uniref:S-locus receptor kinase C-terminal domain-containing protein n=1 Tax=Salix brachista TaxID=2182728 RepID=A0A5N5K2Y2_9ROSI|nr:hypothetical protein DKX38_025906 [Salix brachista]
MLTKKSIKPFCFREISNLLIKTLIEVVENLVTLQLLPTVSDEDEEEAQVSSYSLIYLMASISFWSFPKSDDHHGGICRNAWRLYKEQKSFELIDESLNNTCDLSEVLRVIHVGLLCVQQDPVDRPTMSTVVLMLTSNITLPEPKEPGFFTERKLYDQESSSSKVDTCSANEITITLLTPR